MGVMSKLQSSMNTCNKTFVIEIIHLFYNEASVTVITFMSITANESRVQILLVEWHTWYNIHLFYEIFQNCE